MPSGFVSPGGAPFSSPQAGKAVLGNNTGKAELQVEGTVANGAVIIIEDEAGGLVDLDATTGSSFHASNAVSQCVSFTKSGSSSDEAIRVTADGDLVVFDTFFYKTRAHAAPADARLIAGELALWFDQTNGAAKLMVKAKQADGTVRTGSLPLA